MESDHFCLSKKKYMKYHIWQAEPRTADLGVGLKIFYGAPTVTPIDMTCPKFHILLRNIKYADFSLELKTTLAGVSVTLASSHRYHRCWWQTEAV